ncbi:hypothetical protein AN639_02810 [Candidatus Epulonipiscium fishelsonii]|uniref:Uncharacterized protein n=1 Tax=Candidatus Epulonipiscium fishelsonii TaxID=77094 RepID=A0ACC8X9H7_9FIRM|nr:hypothetical protein AN396_10165 [Epulopiscium sp. SCG-B11WGA-EpuloA1]ONI41873.1 hypothetical protein AN639_02810 [Epulopiscium sp. SCG-B05WGA-EpuloA1]
MAEDTMKSLVRLFKVLEAMTEKEFNGVRELTAKTGINATSIYRMLSTMVKLGYIWQNPETEKYALTYKITALGNLVAIKNPIVNIVHPFLVELSTHFKATAHFVEKVGNRCRYIDKVSPSEGVIATGSYIGMELPLTTTAVGKAMLSQRSIEEVTNIWNSEDVVVYTKNTITDLERLLKELEHSRKYGFGYDNEERENGLFCVAVSLNDFTLKDKYAISLSAPVAIMQGEYLEKVEGYLLKIKQEVSPLLGGIL